MAEFQEDNYLLQQKELFSRIASRYDLVNHLMTGWQDNRWRRFAVKKLELPPSGRLLDIGSGNDRSSRKLAVSILITPVWLPT